MVQNRTMTNLGSADVRLEDTPMPLPWEALVVEEIIWLTWHLITLPISYTHLFDVSEGYGVFGFVVEYRENNWTFDVR